MKHRRRPIVALPGDKVSYSRSTAGLLALVVAATATVLGAFSPTEGTAHAATGQAKTPNTELQVWNVNTHGMATDPAGCTNDNPCTNYQEFVDYITDPTRVGYMPDIVTLQEAGTSATGVTTPSCHNFEKALEAREPGVDYYCYESGKRGGAAIVYRTGRLSYVGGTLQTVQLKERATTGASCDPSSWYALVMRFKDDSNANHYVNAASIHLPYSTDNSDADCAWENMKLINGLIDKYGSAAMHVMAGDWNHTDGALTSSTTVNWECWYSGTNADLGTCGTVSPNLGWKDTMYRACNTTGAAAYNCLHSKYWTKSSTAHNRIDYLFAKSYAIYNQVTVDYALAYQAAGSPSGWPTQYSDHRGEGALLLYY